jgi:hypothetical protein
MDIACLIIGACLVTGWVKKNSPLGACLMDIACLNVGACLVTKGI